MLGVAVEAMTKIGADASKIAAIGITNQRETAIVWDKNTGVPVYHAIVWQCRRTSEYCDSLKARGLTEKFREKTGLVIDAYFSATKIKWILDNVEGAREKAQKGQLLFGTVETWLIWKLTEGAVHAVASSNASSLGCYDLKEKKWYQPIFDHLKVPVSIFPEVLDDAADYGTTNLFGSPIPITGAIADQQSALFSENCHQAGSAKCTNGTGTFMDINIGTEVKLPPDGLDTLIAWTLNGVTYYCYEGMIAVTGSAVQWLRDGLQIINSSAETCLLYTSPSPRDTR